MSRQNNNLFLFDMMIKYFYNLFSAGVAELADASDSKSDEELSS